MGVHAERLRQLTNSNKLYTNFRKMNEEGEGGSGGSRQDYFIKLIEANKTNEMALDFLVQSIHVPELDFIKNQMFMNDSSKSLFWGETRSIVERVKLLQNLCEGNCSYFKELLFLREYEFILDFEKDS